MNNEATNNEWLKERWNLDLDWYRANGCAFGIVAQSYLCQKCRKKLKKDMKPEDIIKLVSGCCAKKDDYIRPEMPVMSGVFSYFLGNGNQPVALETLSRELSEKRGTIAGTSPEILHRLLIHDHYYGLRPLS